MELATTLKDHYILNNNGVVARTILSFTLTVHVDFLNSSLMA
jgi:hypothetical protein